jgi:hypothetical protein
MGRASLIFTSAGGFTSAVGSSRGLITLLACTLRMLLSTLRMLHALCVIALAVLISGGAVRLCSVFVKFGGFVVIAVRHVRFLSFNSQRATTGQTLGRSRMSRNGVAGTSVVPFGLRVVACFE